jgi:dipeptidyl aminopeptidase/acylaminoacyl peptidase
MRFRGLLAAWFLLSAPAVLRAQTAPTEYATFTSQGKAISCAVYEARDAVATIIFLRGPSPDDIALGRLEASFFAEHGFRVLLPDYFGVAPSTASTPVNYWRWSQVVADIVTDLRAHPTAQTKKIALAGQSRGASVALIAGSRRLPIEAVAEWSGFMPNEFFSQVQTMPPLLIIHGELDQEVPILNARQLVRLCELKDFTCETQFYAGEPHLFSPHITDSANQRALAFFQAYLRP